MSSWNYRIVVTEDDEFGIENYAIHEVYYDDKGNINGWSESPVVAGGETRLELLDDLARMTSAAWPVLYWDRNNETLTPVGEPTSQGGDQ